jgi:hypothetical protein
VKDTKTVLLAMVSSGLVITWVYHFYDKSIYSSNKIETLKKDFSAVAPAVQDSLQKLFLQTINNLGTRFDSTNNNQGQFKSELETKLAEFYRLRSEIDLILKKETLKKEDLELAQTKTADLRKLISGLPNNSSNVNDERKMNPISFDEVKIPEKKPDEPLQKFKEDNNMPEEKVNSLSAFVVSDLDLSTVIARDDKETGTNMAQKTNKLVVSFAVKNNVSQSPNAEVFVVIKQPDGKVMNSDVWEAYSMDTNEGRKMAYTRKVKFDYQKGETKHLAFTINPDDYQTGNYSLQIYQNGFKIGERTKALN